MLGGKALLRRIEKNIREVIFGLEDSLVSTLGAITGIAVGTGNVYVVILSGIVLIFVESLSMSAGSYLSSKSAAEVMERRRKQDASRVLQDGNGGERLHALFERKGFSEKEVGFVLDVFQKERLRWAKEVEGAEYHFMPTGRAAVKAGIIMGVCYLIGGIFPILPYLLLPIGDAVIPSIVLTGSLLFAIGAAKAHFAGTSWLKSGFEMAAISLTAALLGYLIGRVVSSLFHVPVV